MNLLRRAGQIVYYMDYQDIDTGKKTLYLISPDRTVLDTIYNEGTQFQVNVSRPKINHPEKDYFVTINPGSKNYDKFLATLKSEYSFVEYREKKEKQPLELVTIELKGNPTVSSREIQELIKEQLHLELPDVELKEVIVNELGNHQVEVLVKIFVHSRYDDRLREFKKHLEDWIRPAKSSVF